MQWFSIRKSACPDASCLSSASCARYSFSRFRLFCFSRSHLLSHCLTSVTETFPIGVIKLFLKEFRFTLGRLALFTLFKQLFFHRCLLKHKSHHLIFKFFLPGHKIFKDKLHRFFSQLVFPVLFDQVLNKTVFLIFCYTFTIIYGTT